MPVNVYVFQLIVEDRVVSQGYSACVVSVDSNWFVDRHIKFLAYLFDPSSLLASDPYGIILGFGGRQRDRNLFL